MSDHTLDPPAPGEIDSQARSGHPAPRSVGANIASLATGQAITWTMTLLWTFVVPRLIGPADMGLWVIATSVTALVGVILTFTPREYLVRQMVADRANARRLLVTALLLRLAAIPAVFLSAALYGRIADLDARAMQVMYIVAAATICAVLLEPAVSVFQATERMQFIAYTEVTNKSFQTLGGVVLALAGLGIVAIAGFGLLVSLFVVLVALLWVRALIGIRAKPLPVIPVVRQASPYWFVTVFFVGYLWADGFMLGILAEPEVVGWYGAATRLFTTMMFVAVIISTASLPRLIAAHTRDPAELFRAARPPFEWVIILGLPVGVGMACIADEVVPFLYGPQYAGSVVPLVILGLCVPVMYVNIIANQVFIASGRPMMMARLLGVAAVFNVAANIILIPACQDAFGNGAIGAAASLLLTEIVQMALALLLVGRQLLTRRTVLRVGGASLAAAGMAVVLILIDGVLFPAQIVIGAGVYLALCLILRVPPSAEMHIARSRAAQLVDRIRKGKSGEAAR